MDQDTKTAAVLAVIGLLATVIHVFVDGNYAGHRMGVLLVFVIVVVVEVACGIGACFAIASVVNAGFGTLNTAIIKLAGIILISVGIGVWFPHILVSLLLLLVTLGLLMKFFEMEPLDALIFIVVLAVIRFIVTRYVIASVLQSVAGV